MRKSKYQMQNLILLETRAEIRVTNSSRNTKKIEMKTSKLQNLAICFWDFLSLVWIITNYESAEA